MAIKGPGSTTSSGSSHSGGHSGYPTSGAASAPTPTVPRPFAYAFSADTAKLVHLVRHGQGYHNVEAALYGAAAYKKQSLMDAHLDDTGKAQCIALGARIREIKLQVDVILVSPLTRTLQTASHMFAGSTSAPRMVAIEMCREAHGGHPCDQRRPIRMLRTEFPHVDFSLVGTDDDTWHNPDRRETVREVSIRAEKFLQILRERPERNIMVVSHGVFLETFLNRCGLFCTDDTIKMKRFENAEMRSIVLGGWI